MSKIAEKEALKAYPEVKYKTLGMLEGGGLIEVDLNIQKREGYIKGYDQALCDIKQRVKEIINNQEKEWGKSNVDIGLYTILGHIVEIKEA